MRKTGLQIPKMKRMLKLYSIRAFPRNSPPREVAWAVFWGVWIGVMPTIGIAIPLTLLVCWLFKIPKAPGVAASFVAIPPTLFSFFYPLGYWIGQVLLDPVAVDINLLDEVKSISYQNIGVKLSMLINQASPHLLAFLIGMLIVASITATIFWFVAYYVVQQKRKLQRSISKGPM